MKILEQPITKILEQPITKFMPAILVGIILKLYARILRDLN